LVHVIGNASVTFYYDADCGICSALAIWATRNTAATLAGIQAHQTELISRGVIRECLLDEAYAISPAGLARGAPAVALLLSVARAPYARGIGSAMTLPLLDRFAAVVYRAVAKHRAQLSRWCGLESCRL
jgi:predicted DCC family thiol-disulfide oxidoreductase YuxK